MTAQLNNIRISLKIDDLSNWNNNSNIILNNGEIALIRLPNNQIKIKVGDGSSQISNLNYLNEQEFFTSKLSAYNAEFGLKNYAQQYSIAEGYNVSAYGSFQHAAGFNTEAISGQNFAFVWNGTGLYGPTNTYKSHGAGTFSINPENGLCGFYIGEEHLANILYTNISNEIEPFRNSVNQTITTLNTNIASITQATNSLATNFTIVDGKVNELSQDIQQKILIDDEKIDQLEIKHISQDDYHNLVNSEEGALSNAIYIVSSDILNMYGEQIKNLADGTEATDAVNLGQVSSSISAVEKTLDNKINQINSKFLDYALSNDVKTITNILANNIDNKVLIDSISTEQFEIKHVSREEYYELVNNEEILSNALYLVSADTINAYNQRIENVADGIEDTDGANVRQLSYKLIDIELVDNGTSLSCKLENRTISTITIDSDEKPIVIAFPNVKTGYARDFILQVNVTLASTENLQIEWEGLDDSWNAVSDSDDWAFLEPGLNVISFTEIN